MTDRFKHIPTAGAGKQDCRRKETKEGMRKIASNKFWDNCEFAKKNTQPHKDGANINPS